MVALSIETLGIALQRALVALVLLAGATSALPAQSDSAKHAVRFSVGGGPMLAINRRDGEARVGYAAQGSVLLVRTGSPLLFRGDLVYAHTGEVGDHMRSTLTTVSSRGDAASAAIVFANVVLRTAHDGLSPYVLAGSGIGWSDVMQMNTASAQSGGAIRFAWQSGGGLRWAAGSRTIGLEGRLQSVQSPLDNSWRLSVPLTVEVSW